MGSNGWRTALAIASRRSKFVAKLLLRRLFQLMSHVRLHVTPVHYYSAIPDVLRLSKTTPQWNKPSAMPGIHIDLDAQLAACERICQPFATEFASASPPPSVAGPGFGHIEAQALRAVVRHLKPSTIVEIGSGVSTYCMLQALASNASPATVRCIDPHPRGALASPSRGVGLEIDARPVEHVPVTEFECLGEGDLLFIDSSHAVKAGGDVNFLVLEVLPRLKPGVWVHFHDIYFPYDFPRDLLLNYTFYNETSLLRAWLTHNARAEIVFCLSHLHYERREGLRAVFPDYDPQPNVGGLVGADAKPFRQDKRHFPSSIYIRIK